MPGTSGDQNGHTTPEIVSEQDELDNTPSHANATPMAIGHAHVNGNGSSRPSTENGVSTAASMAHTPMNDVFLSTLAITPSEQLAGDVSPADSTSALNSGANSSRLSAEIVEDPVAEAAAEREAEGDETAFVLD